MSALFISLSTQENIRNRVNFEKIQSLKRKVNTLIWHWELDFKDACVIFVMWVKFRTYHLLHVFIVHLICLTFGLSALLIAEMFNDG